MEFLLIAILLLFMLQYTRKIDTRKFINDTEPYFRFLMEDDYKFLLSVRFGDEELDINDLFGKRVRNALMLIIVFLFIFMMSSLNFINIILTLIIGFVIFKQPYFKLQRYYKRNLQKINQMLPYYLKSLEILIQHYTIPVAIKRSIETAPDIFKPGLQDLSNKIEAGISTVDPYMEFAKEYPVRDSMRMMRLLYRLGLGSQENKQEQLILFSKTVSMLQNKSREQKYIERLNKMENKTMMMLVSTGGGILLLLLFAMVQMFNY